MSVDTVTLFDDTIAELLEKVEAKFERLKKATGQQRDAQISEIEDLLKDSKKKLHHMKVESRRLPKSEAKAFEHKMASHSRNIATFDENIKDAKAVSRQAPQQVAGSGGFGEGADPGRQDVVDRFGRIQGYQEKSLGTLAVVQKDLQDTEEIGNKVNEDLKRQGEQLKKIDEDLDALGDDITRARNELNAFARRMATDKLILCCLFLLVVGILVAIVLKFVLKSDDDGNDLSPAEITPSP